MIRKMWKKNVFLLFCVLGPFRNFRSKIDKTSLQQLDIYLQKQQWVAWEKTIVKRKINSTFAKRWMRWTHVENWNKKNCFSLHFSSGLTQIIEFFTGKYHIWICFFSPHPVTPFTYLVLFCCLLMYCTLLSMFRFAYSSGWVEVGKFAMERP